MLEVMGLVKRCGDVLALDGCSVNVPSGHLVVLMLVATYGLFLAGARLYRDAVLHAGARLRISEAWHGESARPQPTQR